MTHDDETRAAWLNLLGSGLDEGDPLHESLVHLHDLAEASHPKASTGLPLTLDRADALQLGTEAE